MAQAVGWCFKYLIFFMSFNKISNQWKFRFIRILVCLNFRPQVNLYCISNCEIRYGVICLTTRMKWEMRQFVSYHPGQQQQQYRHTYNNTHIKLITFDFCVILIHTVIIIFIPFPNTKNILFGCGLQAHSYCLYIFFIMHASQSTMINCFWLCSYQLFCSLFHVLLIA